MTSNLISQIKTMKQELNCLILVHNYQSPEIQKLADYIGDSLYLAQTASRLNSEYILFCGAIFMAETAAILNPNSVVIVPDLKARCPMANHLPAKEMEKWQEKYPRATSVVYVNTLAEIKALADVCVTSANAHKIIPKLDSDTILFGPDRNLALHAAKFTDKNIIPMPADGYCYVHRKYSSSNILLLKKEYPEAMILVHPECNPDVQELADEICSTSGMMSFSERSDSNSFIIVTEIGMVDRLKQTFPQKTFIPALLDAICIEQKKNTLYNVFESLCELNPRVEVEEEIASRARKAIEQMLALS